MIDASRPRRLTRAEAKERTRRLILESAGAVFAERGYAGASVELIAENAGFSVGAIYSNFATKADLFVALMSEQTRDRFATVADEPGELVPRLGELMRDTADHNLRATQLRSEFWLYALRNPGNADLVKDEMDAVLELLAGMMPTTGLPADRLAAVVFGLFSGLVQLRSINRDAVPDDLFETALTALLKGLPHASS